MSNYTKTTQQFLEKNLGVIPKDLAVAIIEKVGGENAFLECCAMFSEIGTSLLAAEATDENEAFFNANKEDILAFIKEMVALRDENSIVDSIAALAHIDPFAYDDDIKRLMRGTESRMYHQTLASGFVAFAGVNLGVAYNEFEKRKSILNANNKD